MKKQFQLTAILLMLSLFACSKTPPTETVLVQEAQPQIKLSRQDCTDLEAQLAQETQKHTLGAFNRIKDTEIAISQLPLPEEETMAASVMPSEVEIYPNETIEDFDKRMKEEFDSQMQKESDKEAKLKAKYANIDADFAFQKEKLTSKIKACFDSLEKEN